MTNDSCIYCVDLSGKITPIQVRDAVIKCFMQAQGELMKYVGEITEFKPEEIEKIHVDHIIEKTFKEADGDFDYPSKETLIQVILKLKEYALGVFRDAEIIEKHMGEIKQLIDKLD